ncbi:MAG: triose-phosphate isomerase [Caldisphaera sp.]|jgi:triosephosphate isomerase|nr:triose-phosphate isomerase [Caldisphaera sp.]PMP61173.1 MAG: triose-phosphate isomerase [Caldisphaera sp.]PMP90844.1 MAG: triose-phosphate isomerase [Caldisphaera sp.]
MKSILAVNFKAYDTAFNDVSLELAKTSNTLSSKLSNVRIILAVPSYTVEKIYPYYNDIYLQHLDPFDIGAKTGFLPAESIKYMQVKGSIINHSEHKLVYRDIERIVKVLRNSNKESLVCADTAGEAAGISYLKPDMVAVEPPELIGSGIPVSKAKPEIITESIKAVKAINDIPVLAGAGITLPEDATKALELGASGILIASAIMKAKEPNKILIDFAEAMNSI